MTTKNFRNVALFRDFCSRESWEGKWCKID